MSDSYYSDEALRKQAELDRKHAAGEPIDLADLLGIFQARDPRATAYGSCPTQLAASGDDDTGGYMHADVVDAIVSRELGDGWDGDIDE